MEQKPTGVAKRRAVRRTVGKGAAAAAGAAAYAAPSLTRLAAPSAFAATAPPPPPPPTTSACGSFTGHANFQLSGAAAASAKTAGVGALLAVAGNGTSLTSVTSAAPQFQEVNLDCCAPLTGGNFNIFFTSGGVDYHFHASTQLLAGYALPAGTGTRSPLAPTRCFGPGVTDGGGPKSCFSEIEGWVQGNLDGGNGPTAYAYFDIQDVDEANQTQDSIVTVRVYDANGNLLATAEQVGVASGDGNMQAHGGCP